MSTTTESTYGLQAKEFLSKYGIELSIKPTDSGKCPPFCDGKHIHGDEYRVTMKRPMTGKRLTFPFWNSQRDMMEGKAPTAYDVLACAGSDLNCPEDFTEFCAEYGLHMTLAQAQSASHQGQCDDDVAALARDPFISEQLDQIGADDIRDGLRESGAWDAEELADDEQNRHRAVWLAACDIRENWKEAAK